MDPLDWASFPDQASGGGAPPLTITNLKHLLDTAGVVVRYNVVKKRSEITIPSYQGTDENLDNVTLTHVISLVARSGLQTGQVANFVAALADANAYNPVADWIDSKRWDGTDRLPAFYNTLTEKDEYPDELKCTLMRKWLLSAVAAALLPKGFRNRGVLTLQGPQGIGKTQWVASLLPDAALRTSVVKLDHHLDAYNKDSILGAAAHWICEIGELESSFKKDVARIKGVLTRDSDKVRAPYARAESEFPRRTVFVATVNSPTFLVDETGNSRWWAIPVVNINYAHGIDMQQLFAQLACDYRDGQEWWLDVKEEELLEEQNRLHRTPSAIGERLMSFLDMHRKHEAGLPAKTPTELLIDLGYAHPTNPQCKECAAFLREHLGEPKRIQGQNKWRVPVQSLQGPFGRSQGPSDVDKFD
jgi:predicted P-loop ATPase